MSDRKPMVPNPCHEDWDKLTPEERGHFCTVCQTKVWDLSSLTKQEADAFLASTEGDLCVSYAERKDGSVVHRESNVVPLARLAKRLPAAAGFSLALAACTSGGQKEPDEVNIKPEVTQEVAEEVDTPEVEPQKPEQTEPPTVETKPDDEVHHVKGKWARPEDDPNHKPQIRKGKVARPEKG